MHMDALTILMPILELLALGICASLVVLILAALTGKFFGGFLR
jgi:hypothetical protein